MKDATKKLNLYYKQFNLELDTVKLREINPAKKQKFTLNFTREESESYGVPLPSKSQNQEQREVVV